MAAALVCGEPAAGFAPNPALLCPALGAQRWDQFCSPLCRCRPQQRCSSAPAAGCGLSPAMEHRPGVLLSSLGAATPQQQQGAAGAAVAHRASPGSMGTSSNPGLTPVCGGGALQERPRGKKYPAKEWGWRGAKAFRGGGSLSGGTLPLPPPTAWPSGSASCSRTQDGKLSSQLRAPTQRGKTEPKSGHGDFSGYLGTSSAKKS